MNYNDYLSVAPLLVLLGAALVIALADLWVSSPQRKPTYWMTQFALLAVAVMYYVAFEQGQTQYGMNRLVVSDPMGNALGFFACLATALALAYARPYAASRDLLKGELFTLSMFVLLGIGVMLSANHFLTIYLGLELMSLSLYALTALRRDHKVATEAAMKYFVLGALASGFLLYGMSMLYGATGTLEITEVFQSIAAGADINRAVLVLGVVFIVAGLAFKLGAVPFHMWVPDVYQGAPTAVTLMIGGAPKLAAFAITVRLLVEGLLGLAVDWQQMLIVSAVASLTVGNVIAIAQTNLKRMLAYSTIAHMGFMLLGLASGVLNNDPSRAVSAYSAAMFYMVTYVLTTLGTFGMIILLSRQGFESEQLSDLAGLARRSPWMAGVMSVFMFSLAGIPPTVGFFAKLTILQAVVAVGTSFYITLAIVAVLLSLVGAFYYLRVVKVMWFEEPAHGQAALHCPSDVRVLMIVNGTLVLLLGLVPDTLMVIFTQAIRLTLQL